VPYRPVQVLDLRLLPWGMRGAEVGADAVVVLERGVPPVGRVDNVYGDRNVVCSCPPLAAYAELPAETEAEAGSTV